MAEELAPIIVIKKKSGHGGHHGGAWKVAYADFVTAMMSLFIVLWLMSSTSKQTQEQIAGYFRDPKGTSAKKGMGDTPAPKEAKKDDMLALKNDLLRAIEDINALNRLKKQIEITITEEGLRIEMVEDAKGTFFESGSAKPTPALIEVLQVLSGQLKDLPNKISIEGHTDAQPYVLNASYGNWELSADRANTARREMQSDGIRANQVSQVRGFADQRLHNPVRPLDPANRRISLVVQNMPKPDAVKPEPAKPDESKPGPKQELANEEQKPETKGESAAAASAVAVPPSVTKMPVGLLQKAKGMFH